GKPSLPLASPGRLVFSPARVLRPPRASAAHVWSRLLSALSALLRTRRRAPPRLPRTASRAARESCQTPLPALLRSLAPADAELPRCASAIYTPSRRRTSRRTLPIRQRRHPSRCQLATSTPTRLSQLTSGSSRRPSPDWRSSSCRSVASGSSWRTSAPGAIRTRCTRRGATLSPRRRAGACGGRQRSCARTSRWLASWQCLARSSASSRRTSMATARRRRSTSRRRATSVPRRRTRRTAAAVRRRTAPTARRRRRPQASCRYRPSATAAAVHARVAAGRAAARATAAATCTDAPCRCPSCRRCRRCSPSQC
ncbi:hypothetical protein Ctob_012653, partial [Chrysochromulina tobinii]